jgi:peptidoglycan/xylan/chitin deacetylase (PgdA/CDA1 family)
MRRLAYRSAARVQLEVASRSAGKTAVVLGYHSVGAVAGDPRRELVPILAAGVFRDQLEHLAQRYEVVALAELQVRQHARSAGDRVPAALTFDDDLSGHLQFAAPALSERGMPATFYLTGRTLDGPDPFWWQDLQAIADSGPRGLQDMRDRLATEWPWAGDAGDLHDLARTIEGLPPTETDAVARRLRELTTGVSPDPGLSAAAIRELAAGGFEIGFHTRRHHLLPPMSERELAEAMHEGRDALQAVAGRPLNSIAYPHGRADLRVGHAAAQAGYETGVMWTGGAVRETASRLLLDRTDAWADSVEAFAWRLARVVAHGVRAGADRR